MKMQNKKHERYRERDQAMMIYVCKVENMRKYQKVINWNLSSEIMDAN